jgi:outer membrane protein
MQADLQTRHGRCHASAPFEIFDEGRILHKIAGAALAATLAMTLTGNSRAEEDLNWIVRVGVHHVAPKSDNHPVVNVDAAQMLTFNLTRKLSERWAVELLAALPFKHDVNLNGGGKVADVKHLPPTLSVQYHFAPDAHVRHYVGAGLNATIFFSENTSGALNGADLELDTSFSPAAQFGIDIDIVSTWFLNLDAGWMDIDTEATLDGASLVDVQIDPNVIGVSVGRDF